MNLITIQPIQLNDVLNDDEIRFNSNNHWVNGEKPSDYYQKNRECNTDTWIDLFEREYKTFIIPKYHVKWMKEASKIGNLTGEFPKSFIEELEDYLRENQLPSPGRFFIRTNSHSLKYGKYGLKPYSDLREVIISLVTSPITHDPLHSIDGDCTLYLMKWIEMEKKKEFRVFVFNQKITAISQQNLYSRLINREDELKKWIKIILRYFYSEVNRRLSHLKNYVMDFVLIGEDNQPYFIEVNPFGSEYSSGSALFHWIRDHEILYENGEDVTVRYVV